MSGNTFGRVFRLTTFGESHGPELGGVVDGCPAGLSLTEEDIQKELDKRKPGASPASTRRREGDRVRLLSGVLAGLTTGTPIGFRIPNRNPDSRDYEPLKDVYRPGHADYTYEAKYGFRDHRGGGRASGRETAARVAGGAIAGQLLATRSIRVSAYTRELGGIQAERIRPFQSQELPYFAPDPSVLEHWEQRVQEVRSSGDSIGGVVEILADNVPPGLGEPVFDKLDARLASALMGVGAVKAVEVGSGTEAARFTGSGHNDPLTPEGFESNHAGGVLGGISSGQQLVLRATVKPIPSVSLPQKTVTRSGEATEIRIRGRHDVSAIPRIVPVLKAMTMLVLADMLLLQQGGAGGGERSEEPSP
jgi:chorismate synthase